MFIKANLIQSTSKEHGKHTKSNKLINSTDTELISVGGSWDLSQTYTLSSNRQEIVYNGIFKVWQTAVPLSNVLGIGCLWDLKH